MKCKHREIARVVCATTKPEPETPWCFFAALTSPLVPFLVDFAVELEHRIDFELREGLVESRYWSAVTSHTAYWSSLDIALFLLTFMYKQDQEEPDKSNLDTL